MTQAKNVAKGGSNFDSSGVLTVAGGGTGATTQAAAAAAVLPTQTGNTGKYLTTDGTATSWGTVTSNPGTVTSITAGTGLSGGTITSTGTVALANTTVTAGSYNTANITVNAQGQITAASTGSVSAVTSVATGNGLQGGTITSTGTLSVACPGFNTVGSYCMVWFYQNGNTVSAGSNYASGTGVGQIRSWVLQNGDNTAQHNISGTWKWMGATSTYNSTDPGVAAIACRVS